MLCCCCDLGEFCTWKVGMDELVGEFGFLDWFGLEKWVVVLFDLVGKRSEVEIESWSELNLQCLQFYFVFLTWWIHMENLSSDAMRKMRTDQLRQRSCRLKSASCHSFQLDSSSRDSDIAWKWIKIVGGLVKTLLNFGNVVFGGFWTLYTVKFSKVQKWVKIEIPVNLQSKRMQTQ